MVSDVEDLRNEAVINKLNMIEDSVQNYLKEKIELAIKNKYIKQCNPELAAFIIYKVYTALMYEYTAKDNSINEKEVSDSILKILKEGILN